MGGSQYYPVLGCTTHLLLQIGRQRIILWVTRAPASASHPQAQLLTQTYRRAKIIPLWVWVLLRADSVQSRRHDCGQTGLHMPEDMAVEEPRSCNALLSNNSKGGEEWEKGHTRVVSGEADDGACSSYSGDLSKRYSS